MQGNMIKAIVLYSALIWAAAAAADEPSAYRIYSAPGGEPVPGKL